MPIKKRQATTRGTKGNKKRRKPQYQPCQRRRLTNEEAEWIVDDSIDSEAEEEEEKASGGNSWSDNDDGSYKPSDSEEEKEDNSSDYEAKHAYARPVRRNRKGPTAATARNKDEQEEEEHWKRSCSCSSDSSDSSDDDESKPNSIRQNKRHSAANCRARRMHMKNSIAQRLSQRKTMHTYKETQATKAFKLRELMDGDDSDSDSDNDNDSEDEVKIDEKKSNQSALSQQGKPKLCGQDSGSDLQDTDDEQGKTGASKSKTSTTRLSVKRRLFEESDDDNDNTRNFKDRKKMTWTRISGNWSLEDTEGEEGKEPESGSDGNQNENIVLRSTQATNIAPNHGVFDFGDTDEEGEESDDHQQPALGSRRNGPVTIHSRRSLRNRPDQRTGNGRNGQQSFHQAQQQQQRNDSSHHSQEKDNSSVTTYNSSESDDDNDVRTNGWHPTSRYGDVNSDRPSSTSRDDKLPSFYCCPICYVEAYRRLQFGIRSTDDDVDDDDKDRDENSSDDIEISDFSYGPFEIFQVIDPTLKIVAGFCFRKLKHVKHHLNADHGIECPTNRDYNNIFHRFHTHQADGLVQRYYKKQTPEFKRQFLGLGRTQWYFKTVVDEMRQLRRQMVSLRRNNNEDDNLLLVNFWSSFSVRGHRIWNILQQSFRQTKDDSDDEMMVEDDSDVESDNALEAIQHDLLDRQEFNAQEEVAAMDEYINGIRERYNLQDESELDDLVNTDDDEEEENENEPTAKMHTNYGQDRDDHKVNHSLDDSEVEEQDNEHDSCSSEHEEMNEDREDEVKHSSGRRGIERKRAAKRRYIEDDEDDD